MLFGAKIVFGKIAPSSWICKLLPQVSGGELRPEFRPRNCCPCCRLGLLLSARRIAVPRWSADFFALLREVPWRSWRGNQRRGYVCRALAASGTQFRQRNDGARSRP